MKKSLLLIFILILIAIIIIGFIILRQPEAENGQIITFPLGEIRDFFRSSPQTPDQTIFEIDTDGPLDREVLILQISEQQISDMYSLIIDNDSFIFYLEKQTGHIYISNKENPFQSKRRLSNTTIINTKNLYISEESETLRIIVTDLNDNVWVGSINKNEVTSPEEIRPINLNRTNSSINNLTPDKNNSNLFYLENFNGGVVGGLIDFNLNNKREIFSSPIRWWDTEPINDEFTFISQPTSHYLNNNLYRLNNQTGEISKILERIQGLTYSVSPDGRYIFYSRSNNNNLSNYLFNTENNTVINLPIKTLADKCTWKTENELQFLYCGVSEEIELRPYPDDWYKGLYSFNDNLWVINPDLSTINRVWNFEFPVDIQKLKVLDYKTLIFINKKDSSLWMIELVF